MTPQFGRRLSRRRLLRGVAAGAVAAGAAALGWSGVGSTQTVGARETRSIYLTAGWNGATWCGPDIDAVSALGDLPLRAAYGWEIADQRWTVYAPGAPSSLTALRHGQPVLMYLTADTEWRQPPAPNALPASPELPVGWSLLGWSGLNETVWDVFGEDPLGPVAEAWRWNVELEEWLDYVPGESAQQLFAVLHPGDAVWVRLRTSGVRWNPALGIIPSDYVSQRVVGKATYYHPSLAGGTMYCDGSPYNPQDPGIAAAVTWPCGTRLRVWRDGRSVDVIVQDTGLLSPNHVDLSEAAFQRIGILAEGRIEVLIEVLSG